MLLDDRHILYDSLIGFLELRRETVDLMFTDADDVVVETVVEAVVAEDDVSVALGHDDPMLELDGDIGVVG